MSRNRIIIHDLFVRNGNETLLLSVALLAFGLWFLFDLPVLSLVLCIAGIIGIISRGFARLWLQREHFLDMGFDRGTKLGEANYQHLRLRDAISAIMTRLELPPKSKYRADVLLELECVFEEFGLKRASREYGTAAPELEWMAKIDKRKEEKKAARRQQRPAA